MSGFIHKHCVPLCLAQTIEICIWFHVTGQVFFVFGHKKVAGGASYLKLVLVVNQ